MAIDVTKKLLAINSASSLMTRILSITVLLWMNKYLLDSLEAEEFSLYPVIASVIAFSPLLSGFLTSGVARFAVEAHAKGDDRRVTQIVSTMFPLLSLAGVIICALGLVFSSYVDRILTIGVEMVPDAQLMAALMMCEVVFRVVSLPFCIGPYVRQNFVILNLITLGTALLRMALLLTLLVGVAPRVLWIPVASVAASICGGIVTIVISRRMLPALKFRWSEIQWRVAGSVTQFGAWFYLGQLTSLVFEHSGKIILNKLGSATDVNAFHVGSLADKQIRGTVMVGSSPLQPAMTTLHSQGQKERLGNAYLRGNRYGLWATLFVGVPLFVFRTEVVRLYIDEVYIDAATVIALLLMTYPFIYSNHMLPKLAVATGELRPFELRAIATHIVNVALSVYFVWRLEMGAVGPALATFLVCAVGQPLLFWALGWRMAAVSSSRWVKEVLVPGMIPALAAGSVLYAIKYFDSAENWGAVCGYSAVGCLAYVIVLVLFCLQTCDKNDLRSTLISAKAKCYSSQEPTCKATVP